MQPISLNRKLPSVTRRASGRRSQRRQHAEEAAAEIGAEHEAERDRERDHVQRGERGDQQHDGETRVAQDRHQRGDQHAEQHVARQRGQDHLDAGGLDDRLGRDRDPLQREHDEAEADQHAPEPADRVGLPGEEEHDADEDQERRQPGQVERQDDGDERRADVGAEHHRQRLRPCRSIPARRTRRRSARSPCCSGSAR